MEKWQAKAEELFGEALDLPREQRDAFLDAACRGTPSVRRAVEGLLAENDRLSGFLSESPYKKVEETAATGTAAHLLKAETRLGRYLILEPLGSGGMGVVYRARDEKLERMVAIKLLAAGVLSGEEARRHFRREALALAKLNHPRIAAVYDVGEQDGADFIVMELVEGESLALKMRAGALGIHEATRIALQVAEALEEAHEHGVIHRDLKPANVMITPKGKAKVLDFGVAKMLALGTDVTLSLPETGGILGTPLYMSPEQALGRKADARTDLWSLGVLYYELLAGRPPFQGSGTLGVLHAITEQPPAPIRKIQPDIPPLAEHIVTRALEKDCELRYQNAADLRTDLQRLIRDSSRSPWDASSPGQEQGDRGEPRPVAPALAPKDRDLRYQSAADMRTNLQRLKRDTELGSHASSRAPSPATGTLHRGRILVGALLILLALAAGGAVWRWYMMRSKPIATAADKPSIAVLPLQNLSGDPANDYFSDGMTEEIGTKLSHIRDLQVASYYATRRFKYSQDRPDEIGRELQVRYLLQGSVRKVGDQVRISAQLMDARTGYQIWADDFTGNLNDVFALQEQTALKITQALNLHLSPQERKAIEHRYTQNAEAYDAYLRGASLGGHLGEPNMSERARSEFEKALQLDPNYAPALAGLSEVELNYYRNIDSNKAHLLLAEDFARRALAVDSQLGEAYVALSGIYGGKYDYEGAAEQARTAIRLEPENASAWGNLAWALTYTQPPDAIEAEKAARESIRLQPLNPNIYYQLGRALLLQKRFPEAIAAMEQSGALDPSGRSADVGIAQIYLAQGSYDRALAILLKPDPNKSALIPLLLSSVYAARGDREKALHALDQALAEGYGDFAAIDANPYYSQLRSDPRFQQIIQRYRTQ